MASLVPVDDEDYWFRTDLFEEGQPREGAATATCATLQLAEPVLPPPEPYVSEADGKSDLSTRQLKKQVLRDKRNQKKDQKKLRRHEDALQETIVSLESSLGALLGVQAASSESNDALMEHLSMAFGITDRYSSLPFDFGPDPNEGVAALATALVRLPKYNDKFLPQEYSLLHKAWALFGGDCNGAGIVDFGAGNANCGVLAAAVFGICVICVERESPRAELRAEAQLPPHLQHLVIRVESDIEDFRCETLLDIASKAGLHRFVLMAKHPCGIGVDRSIDCAARLVDQSDTDAKGDGAKIVGMVMATCCIHKLASEHMCVSRVPEFCGLYANALPIDVGNSLQCSIELMSRCSSWRTTAQDAGIQEVTQQKKMWAELFEDSLQAVRKQRLRDIFGAAHEVRFAPLHCTLQDRCMVAGPAQLPSDTRSRQTCASDADLSHADFIVQVRTSVKLLLEGGGPIDCRPKGLRRCGFCALCTEVGAVWSTRRAQRCATFLDEGQDDNNDDHQAVLNDVNC